jgi:hypothetical protein
VQGGMSGLPVLMRVEKFIQAAAIIPHVDHGAASASL